MCGGQIECRAIAGRQQLLLVRIAAVPYRSDGVDDVPCLQPITLGDLSRAGRAAAECPARGKQFRPRRAMDGAVYPAAAEAMSGSPH